jgi:hypothetical protein
MKNNFRIATALLLVAVFFFGNLQTAKACGPFSLYAAFSYEKHPDLPLDNFARGELGILKTSFARSYLVIAYRHLNGLGLNSQQQSSAVSLWHERLGVGNNNEEQTGGVSTWLEARKKVVADSKEISVEREVKKDSYQYYQNCLPDAFNKAAQTLQERINKFGANNQDVKDWVSAQDVVFSNCSEGQNIPGEPNLTAPAIIKADRAYQIAAAYFYSANFDEAKARFEKISNDTSSPYNGAAALLVARSLIRKASVIEDKAIQKDSLSQAQAQLMKVVANKNFSAYHKSANNLLNLVSFRSEPTVRLHQLAQIFSNRTLTNDIKQYLWDYTMLLDKVAFESNDAPAEGQTQIPFAEATKDELTDWIFAFENGDKGFDHAVEKYERTKSQIWLTAALALAQGNNPKSSSLISATDSIPANSPAYLNANYHAIRLQIEAGQKDEARTRLDSKILSPTSLNNLPSSLNQFLNLRMAVATALDDFLKYAQRKPAGYVWDYDGNEMPDNDDEDSKKRTKDILFDFDATNVLNGMLPLASLQAATQNTQLPANLRKRLAIATLTRAIVLDRHDVGKAIAPILSQLEPSLKPLIDSYLKTSTPTDSKSAGLYLILKTPMMRPFVDTGIGRETPLFEIDSYRDNWWCGEIPRVLDYNSEGEPKERKTLANADFLTQAQKAAAISETTKLVSLGTAPNYLAQQAVLWAQRVPQDPRVPEALHLAVAKATRYGCTDEGTGKASKAAFDVLKKNYPKTEWAKKTPYWFKGDQ